MKQLNFQMDGDTHKQLLEQSEQLGISQAEFVRRALEQALAAGLKDKQVTRKHRANRSMGFRSALAAMGAVLLLAGCEAKPVPPYEEPEIKALRRQQDLEMLAEKAERSREIELRRAEIVHNAANRYEAHQREKMRLQQARELREFQERRAQAWLDYQVRVKEEQRKAAEAQERAARWRSFYTPPQVIYPAPRASFYDYGCLTHGAKGCRACR